MQNIFHDGFAGSNFLTALTALELVKTAVMFCWDNAAILFLSFSETISSVSIKDISSIQIFCLSAMPISAAPISFVLNICILFACISYVEKYLFYFSIL